MIGIQRERFHWRKRFGCFSQSMVLASRRASLRPCSEVGSHCRTCSSAQLMLQPEAITALRPRDASVRIEGALTQTTQHYHSSRTYASQGIQKGSEPADYAVALLQPPSPGQLAASAPTSMKAQERRLQECLSHVVRWWQWATVANVMTAISRVQSGAHAHISRYEIQVRELTYTACACAYAIQIPHEPGFT